MAKLKLFGKRTRDAPRNAFTLTEGWEGSTLGGDTEGYITPESAMRLSGVYACVRVIAETIAQLPLDLMQYNDRGGTEKATDHPLYYLLHTLPNPEMTSFTFREVMTMDLCLHGNAYAQKIYNGKGEIVELIPLLASNMDVRRNERGALEYHYTIESGKEDAGRIVTLRRDEVLHIPGMGFNGLVGFSPIEMARRTISSALSCEEYGGQFYQNGTFPSGYIEHPGTIKDVTAFREKFAKAFSGAKNAGKVPVLEGGMKYNTVSVSPADAQFIESRKYSLGDIARLFRMPPHMIGDLDKATFSNIEHQSLEFVKYTIDPWVVRWEQGLMKDLMLAQDRGTYFIRLNVDGLMRGDYKSRMEGYAIGRQNGWMSANDIRRLEDIDTIPPEEGGDDYLVNGNMVPIRQGGNSTANQTTS